MLSLKPMRNNHEALVDRTQTSGAEVTYLDDTPNGLADSIFTYDPSLVTPRGATILRPRGSNVDHYPSSQV